MVTEKIFETTPGISGPWLLAGMNFELSQRKLNIPINFEVFEVSSHFSRINPYVAA